MKHRLKKLARRDRARAAFVLLFVAVGGSLIVATRAAPPTADFEAESGALTPQAQVVPDATASNAHYLGFAVPSGSASSASIPVGDLPGWRQIFRDDFTVDAPLGSWGSQCDHQRIAYTGASGSQWRSYPSCFLDTYQKRPYRADQVLSVHDGILDFHLHKVDGVPAGANPSPLIKSGSQYQTYGRYAARFRVTGAAALSDYYVAWLTWPQSGNWNGSGPGDGEIDFPEGHLNNTIGGFHHCLSNNSVNCGSASTGGATFSAWHTFIIEWTPQAVKFILDNQTVMNFTEPAQIPNTPMRWQLQTETNGPGTSEASGHLELDWVAVYERS